MASHPEPNEHLGATRIALHRLAAYVVAPVRFRATGRFGLRAAPGGCFRTPEFDGRTISVEGRTLVDEVAGERRTAAITSLGAAAEFLGSTIDPETAAEHDSPPVGDSEADLGVDLESSELLGWWFNTAFSALERVVADDGSIDASEPQLWPGHFDPAIEVGDEDHRGSYGASPGDAAIDEPYLYLSLWWPDRLDIDAADPYWNAPSFTGRLLRLSEFDAAQDPVDVAADFWIDARNRAS